MIIALHIRQHIQHTQKVVTQTEHINDSSYVRCICFFLEKVNMVMLLFNSLKTLLFYLEVEVPVSSYPGRQQVMNRHSFRPNEISVRIWAFLQCDMCILCSYPNRSNSDNVNTLFVQTQCKCLQQQSTLVQHSVLYYEYEFFMTG